MTEETMKEEVACPTQANENHERLSRHDNELDMMESGSRKGEESYDKEMVDFTESPTEEANAKMISEKGTCTKEDSAHKIKGAKGKPEDGSRIPKRLKDMYTQADWWSLWIGLTSFILAIGIVFIVPYEIGDARLNYVIPQPMKWVDNPLHSWDLYNVIGVPVLILFLGSLYLLALEFMGKMNDEKPISKYAKGFAGMSVIAVISFWLGRQEWCAKNGLGYAIFSILFGMIIANTPLSKGDRLSSLKLAAKDGEFFIKSSLVLLAVEFSVLDRVGWQSIVVAWVGSPVALIAGYLIGTRLFRMDAGIAILVAVGSTWCGASAISAVAAIIGSSSADITLGISVVAFFTVIFTFAQAFFALGVGMPHDVAGAWIGGSVDQTGNVIASAAIISEEATEIAGIVKIILNSGLGILATVIAFCWQAQPENKKKKKGISLLFIWDKFPKFVLGYVLCSAILTVVIPQLDGTPEGKAIQTAIITLNKWWFALAFVGIGIGTSVKDLLEGALKSGVLKLYMATNLLDIAIALGLAYAVF